MNNALTPMDNDVVLPGELPEFGVMPTGAPMGQPPFMSPPRHLSKKQKAAIIIRLLLAEGAQLPLSGLPEAMQSDLIENMSEMRLIDKGTVAAVVDEFISEMQEVGLTFPGGLEGALDILDGTLDPTMIARVRKNAGVKITGNPWETIAGIDPKKLLPILEEESTEVAAVLLSKLKVSVAAELLGQLPGPRARKVAYAVSLTGNISPEVVHKIGRSLAEQLDAQPVSAFTDGPVERVGAILNFSPAATRDDVLNGLDEEDQVFAEEVRKAIFTFANIPARIDPRDVPKITKDIDQAVLITALTAATGELEASAEFILGAMSKRMAEQIREEMQSLGKVKAADGEAAMNAVISRIREMEGAGEILLIAEDEE
ncbi:Flagellar motor switch protein FliG [Aliiroseovarius sp. xm-m-379]|uniref:flagellar motor switch protein FliG n=1 Tax=unclassified Aliiroseovarius TaxID=2623558 RepID=UPI0019D9620B|nr:MULTISPECIES: FliG C-terminal domain-containing protein [unclassified Aliiroseovarius]NRP12499.1 Flagellar motor switch protein FliG [Aliiroseovarius sp. xm-d-517]NRP24873.1 Flagellar motor switch protein FliG [Aliiroseovarius sp. xm-m-379]NRP30491.1 Flagellar motor switch protein FliG [Aliiroseovarius sp. xm-m-314]NRP33672.1 Flagellar motor switch protein FliG [Aliiroseovarius sp. xm-a-104]NRP40779.1 Flagellar motor switch protein FliG [Aliiroseovarius sp. xm-m-339-2]